MPYDLHFIEMMRMHHRQGIAMGRVAEKKGSTAVLVFLTPARNHPAMDNVAAGESETQQ